MTPEIRPLKDIEAVPWLAQAARDEGFAFLDRLVEEWETGVNRFDSDGELLFGAFDEGRLVATGGLTRQREDLGRLRRIYVHPQWRGQGIATGMVVRILAEAGERFPEVVLYTDNPAAARLYERLGFVPESPDGPDHATHRRRLS